MTYVARCRLDAVAPRLRGRVHPPPAGEYMAPPLWSYAPVGWVMREPSSAIDAAGHWRASPSACRPAAWSGVHVPCWTPTRPRDLAAPVNDAPPRSR